MVNMIKDYKPQRLYAEPEFQNRQRHGLMMPAMLIGLLTGAMSVGFHVCVDAGEKLRNQFIASAYQDESFGAWIVFGLAFSAVITATGLVSRFAPEAVGSGIPHLKAVLLGKRQPFRWLRVLVVKFMSTFIGITGGLVLGQGGPCVHMGSAIGQGMANLWPSKTKVDHSILVAAGGGAGLAAAFNAPLSGLVFVLEELERRCSSLEFYTAAIACLSADVVCRAILGQHSIFHLTIVGIPPLNALIAFLPLGILSALLGILFTRTLLWGQNLINLNSSRKLAWCLVLATMLSVTGWFVPKLLGGGQNFVNEVLDGKEQLTLQSVGLFFFIRFVLTIGSSSSGTAGGIFMPILVLGALLGWGVGETTQLLFPALHIDSKLFAVVGMAAYFSAIVQAPLTGIVLIIEMTQDYELILPLFIACFSALQVAGWLGCPPIYEALMKIDLRHPLRDQPYCPEIILNK